MRAQFRVVIEKVDGLEASLDRKIEKHVEGVKADIGVLQAVARVHTAQFERLENLVGKLASGVGDLGAQMGASNERDEKLAAEIRTNNDRVETFEVEMRERLSRLDGRFDQLDQRVTVLEKKKAG